MARKKEEPQGTSSVDSRVPDFVDDDGFVYSDIEVIAAVSGRNGAQMNKAAHRKSSPCKARRVSTPDELEIQGTLASIQEEQEEAGGCHDSDSVIQCLLERKIPLTQKNYLELCNWGSKPLVEDLGCEELADLPSSFFAWPVDERSVRISCSAFLRFVSILRWVPRLHLARASSIGSASSYRYRGPVSGGRTVGACSRARSTARPTSLLAQREFLPGVFILNPMPMPTV
jgi:hypothetical protein